MAAGARPAGGRAGLIALLVATALGLGGLLAHHHPAITEAVAARGALPRPFAPTSFWNTRLRAGTALDPGSATLVKTLVWQQRERGSWINTRSYSSPVYTVPAAQRTVHVQIDHPASPNAEALQREMQQVPMPADARPATGSDGRMIVWQTSTDTMWEFWRAHYESRLLRHGWHAGWGAKIEHVSRSSGVNRWPFGATASGLALAGGLITLDDMRRGEIDHVLALGVPGTRAGEFVAPANRTDGHDGGPYTIPEGTRYRLDPRVDVGSLGLSRVGRMIALAAQRYGMVVRDGSDVVTFYAQDPSPSGFDPYPEWFGGKSAAGALKGFPWQRLQALRPSSG